MDASPRTTVTGQNAAAPPREADVPAPDEPFRAPGNLGDEPLADLIDRDVADRLVRGLPISIERYLASMGEVARRPLALDAAIDGALRSLAAGGLSCAEAVERLAIGHPDLRRVIESTATISMLFGPSGAAHEALEAARERPLPSRFGRVLPDGKGRYELVESLGQRRPPRVFRAIDHLLSRPGAQVEVVVKILGQAGDQAQLDVAIEEARLLRSLRHEAIVPLVDSGVSDDAEAYLVTEFIHGASLREHLGAKGRLSAAESVRLVASLAHAVGMAHRALLIHCDLSPANLLVDAEGRARIVDLGSAAHVGSTTSIERAMQGTPGFMAPEQSRPGTRAAPTLDVYALGAVLFWILTGSSVNGRDTAEIDSVLRGASDPRAWRQEALAKMMVPRSLARLTLAAVDVDPARRPPDADSLARRLDHWLEEDARSRLSVQERLVASARRHPRLSIILTAAVTALVTLLVVTYALTPREAPRRGVEYTLMAARGDRALAYALSRYDRSLKFDRDEARALLARLPQILGTTRAPAGVTVEWMRGPEGARLASLLAGLQIISARHGESTRIDSLFLRTALAALVLAQGRDATPILRGGAELETLLSPGDPLRSIAVGVGRGAAARLVADGLQSGRMRPGWPAPENALVSLDASIRESATAERDVIVRLLQEQRDRLAAAMEERSSRPAVSTGSTEGAAAPRPD